MFLDPYTALRAQNQLYSIRFDDCRAQPESCPALCPDAGSASYGSTPVY